jgi:REP element-mobilizing transposase RayT
MNHEQRQLVLFSSRRRVKKKHLPRRVTTLRTRSRVPHETRPDVKGPIHVVWRIKRGLPDLRTPRGLRRLERAFRKGKERDGFALLHYSIQHDHLHLMVEVKNRRKLSKGLQALGIRIAKSLNSLWRRRRGGVFAERYFAAALQSLRQVWRTIRYVLSNGRKHGSWRVKGQPDPYSSGRWYLPWRVRDIRRPLRSSPVVESSSIAFFIPYIGVDEVPGPQWRELELGPALQGLP